MHLPGCPGSPAMPGEYVGCRSPSELLEIQGFSFWYSLSAPLVCWSITLKDGADRLLCCKHVIHPSPCWHRNYDRRPSSSVANTEHSHHSFTNSWRLAAGRLPSVDVFTEESHGRPSCKPWTWSSGPPSAWNPWHSQHKMCNRWSVKHHTTCFI